MLLASLASFKAFTEHCDQIFLDHEEDPEFIKANLDSLVILSHHMDIAVGIGHIKPMTLKVLKEEIPRLEQEGYRLIRLSHAVR